MEFGKQHDTTQQTQRTFARVNLLRTCYGETGVMVFGKTSYGESLLTCCTLATVLSFMLLTC